MDTLLSNAQRCGRKADSLVKFGLFDEALIQLDKAIEYLKELKSNNTQYENIQLIKVQIEAFDRKMTTVAIKRAESIKKKHKIESLINGKRLEAQQKALDQAPVIIEHHSGSAYFANGSKLHKDEKSVIEELATTNSEFKKVNTFLINEIEQLKRENEQLKVELLKMHMNNSMMSSADSDSVGGSVIAATGAISSTDHQVKNIYEKYNLPATIDSSSLSLSDQDDLSENNKTGVKASSGGGEEELEINIGQYSGSNYNLLSNSNISYSSSSCGTNTCSTGSTNSSNKTPVSAAPVKSIVQPHTAHEVMVCNARNSNRIDLSKYIDNDESDENTDDDDSDESNQAPLEFTIDS